MNSMNWQVEPHEKENPSTSYAPRQDQGPPAPDNGECLLLPGAFSCVFQSISIYSSLFGLFLQFSLGCHMRQLSLFVTFSQICWLQCLHFLAGVESTKSCRDQQILLFHSTTWICLVNLSELMLERPQFLFILPFLPIKSVGKKLQTSSHPDPSEDPPTWVTS